MQEKQKKGWRMSCDVGIAAEGLENELHLRHSSFSNPSATLPTPQLILQPFRCFAYVIAHSPTHPPLHLRHSSFYSPSVASPTSQALHLRHISFSNPSAASPTSQVILQPFRCFTYVTGTSRTSTGVQHMHRGMKTSVWWTSVLQHVMSLEVATVLDSC